MSILKQISIMFLTVAIVGVAGRPKVGVGEMHGGVGGTAANIVCKFQSYWGGTCGGGKQKKTVIIKAAGRQLGEDYSNYNDDNYDDRRQGGEDYPHSGEDYPHPGSGDDYRPQHSGENYPHSGENYPHSGENYPALRDNYPTSREHYHYER